MKRLRQYHKPIIAAVNGIASGGGLAMACLADLRLQGEEAAEFYWRVIRGLIDSFRRLGSAHVMGHWTPSPRRSWEKNHAFFSWLQPPYQHGLMAWGRFFIRHLIF